MIDFLQEHILSEQRYMTWDGRMGRLNEIHGQIPNLDQILDLAWEKAQNLPKYVGTGKKGTIKLQDLNIPFIESGDLDVILIPEDPEERQGRCSDSFKLSHGKGQNVWINISVSASSSFEREHLFKAILAHELTHIYERVYRLVHNRPETKDRQIFYKVALDYAMSPDKLIKSIGNFLYSFDFSEQNAYIGQLKAELRPYALELNDSKKAAKRIRETEAYGWYASIPHWIEKIRKESSEEQEKILVYWNELVGGKYKKQSFKDLILYLEKRWLGFRTKFMNRAGKVCSDLYDEAVNVKNETFDV